MKKDMGLSQVIYNVIKTQIQFGVYHFGDTLPTMENASDNFFVAPATIRSAYLQLQQEGYITMSPNKGSMIICDYTEQEIESYIQLFFSQRKNALIDLSKSLRLLFGHARWMGLKHAGAKFYNDMLKFNDNDTLQPYFAFNYILRTYGSLQNELLNQLLWQIFTFLEAPFFSISENAWCLYILKKSAPRTLDYYQKQDWDSLRKEINDSQDLFSQALCSFYDSRITARFPQQEIAFTWSAYKKNSQICYSLGMEILTSITRGQYAANSLLPSLDKMAKERNVSVSTIRRTLSLLNGVGAAKSVNGVGTRVLPFSETPENCDFTKPVVCKRLLDVAQSLQFLMISCQEIAEATILSLNAASLQIWIETLSHLKERQQYELTAYVILDLISQFAPYQAIRTVYTEFLQQLFWGYSLRDRWQKYDQKMNLCISYYESFICSLENADAAEFSLKIKELMIHELNFTVKQLIELGINEAERLLLDD